MPTSNSQHYDVVIAGARCAGAATAMLLARQGARVLLLDRSRYGTDTLSTHALMRGAVLQLHKWGLLAGIAAGTPAVRSSTFHLPDGTLTVQVKPLHGVDALYAPRRIVLDAILADAARSAGAEVRFGTSVTGLRRGRTGRVTGVTGRAAGPAWKSAPIWSSARMAAAPPWRGAPVPEPLTSPPPPAPSSTVISARPPSRAITGTMRSGQPPGRFPPTTG